MMQTEWQKEDFDQSASLEKSLLKRKYFGSTFLIINQFSPGYLAVNALILKLRGSTI